MSSSVLQGVDTVPVLLGKSSPRSLLPGGFALTLGKSGGPPASLCFLSKLGWKCVSFRVSPQGTEQHSQRGDTETVTHHCVRCLRRPTHITVHFLVKGVAPAGPSGTHSISLHPIQMVAQRMDPQGLPCSHWLVIAYLVPSIPTLPSLVLCPWKARCKQWSDKRPRRVNMQSCPVEPVFGGVVEVAWQPGLPLLPAFPPRAWCSQRLAAAVTDGASTITGGSPSALTSWPPLTALEPFWLG